MSFTLRLSLPALVLAFASVCSPSVARAVDCGRLPTGKNPSMEKLDQEVSRVSAALVVPTEIIKAIAWRESGCQQWRPDGSFVHNTTDCGLGMMQLTGATARQFDVERLKDDWRYNLECGVKVLDQKWARAQRQGLVSADPAERRVLENWYYAIAFYWGGRTEDYLKKVFDHMQKRPGRLQQLLRRSVTVTLPSAVIPGFTFGDKFTAFAGDRFEAADGTAYRASTHAGTIGDPATLARLDVLLARGRRYVEREDPRKAARYLLEVIASDYDTEHKAEAEALLAQLAEAARARIAEAKELAAQGEAAASRRILKRVIRDHDGLAVADEARAALD